MSCAIEGCTSHTGRKDNVQEPLSFHRFPKDEEIKQKWLLHVKKRNWTWKIHSRVCSRHFTPDSFIANENFKWRRLKADAFPTLYLSDTDPLGCAPVPMDFCDAERLEVSSHVLEEFNINNVIPKKMIIVPTPMTEDSDVMVVTPKRELSVESDVDICELNKEIKNEPLSGTVLIGNSYQEPPCNQHDQTFSRWQQELDGDINTLTKEPQCRIKQECNASVGPACNQHEKIIMKLQHELKRTKRVSQQRLRKINTLTKSLSRITKKNVDLYSILMKRLNEENSE